MTMYTRYASRTGEILATLDIPDTLYDMHSTLLYPGTVNAETHYFVDGEPVERPELTLSVSSEQVSVASREPVTISGLPEPAQVTVEGPGGTDTATVDDGQLDLLVGIPGTYTVTIDAFPYLKKLVVIHAV